MSKDSILIRGITEAVRDRLSQLAVHHNRSVEGEARHALQNWAHGTHEPELVPRLRDVGSRLAYALEQANAGRAQSSDELSPSKVAERIGDNCAAPAEAWFRGEQEPTFTQLDAIARIFGMSASWLKHGDGHPYSSTDDYIRLTNLDEAAPWLLGLAEEERPVKFLRFVRNSTPQGQLLIVKQWSDYTARVYRTPYHVSSETGAGGEADLAALSVLWHLLYRSYSRLVSRLPELSLISSHIASPEQFSALVNRKINPITIVEKTRSSPWWEDLWDRDMFSKPAYIDRHWEGFGSLSESIYQKVKRTNHLQDLVVSIENGSHPFLAQLQT